MSDDEREENMRRARLAGMPSVVVRDKAGNHVDHSYAWSSIHNHMEVTLLWPSTSTPVAECGKAAPHKEHYFGDPTDLQAFCSGEAVTNIIRTDEYTAADRLTKWWRETAESEIDMVVAKATEYGGEGRAIDLIWIGREMAVTMGRAEVSDEEATELGIYYYLLGKFGRWTAAIRGGRRVSDDGLLDIGVYVRMAQRNRQKGGWPE